jgi:hypothetical protein
MEDKLRVAVKGEGRLDAVLISSKVRSSILLPVSESPMRLALAGLPRDVRAMPLLKPDGKHQILFFVNDARDLGCIAKSLQRGGLASIGPTDDKYAKVAVFLTNVEGVEDVGHVNSECGSASAKMRITPLGIMQCEGRV